MGGGGGESLDGGKFTAAANQSVAPALWSTLVVYFSGTGRFKGHIQTELLRWLVERSCTKLTILCPESPLNFNLSNFSIYQLEWM